MREGNVENRRRYGNILRKMNLQDEDSISDALKRKGFYSSSDSFPLSSLHFELTSRCNAFCKHCYNNSGSNSFVDNMTPDDWIKFSQYIVNHGGVFECLLSGGEPLLLGEKLFDIMDILHNDGTIFLVMTNGYLMTEEFAKKFSKYQYHWFQISIDGVTEEYHDTFRNLPGSWKRAVKATEYVTKYGIPLKIAHCVTPYNLDDIDDMCELAHSLGASSIMLGGISLSGRTGKNKDMLLSNKEKELLYEKIEYNRKKFHGRLCVKSTNSVRKGLENHSRRPRSGVVIRPNGDIRIDGMAPFVIGNILQGDFADLWERKIDTCWNDARVQQFIDEFDNEDHNNNYINYLEKDIYL